MKRQMVSVMVASILCISSGANAASHNYSTTRGNQYGYTDATAGEVHFFEFKGIINGTYTLVSYDGYSVSFIMCRDDCRFVRVQSAGTEKTFEPQPGSILQSVVADMLSGQLAPTLRQSAAATAPSAVPRATQEDCNLLVGTIASAAVWRDNGVPLTKAQANVREVAASIPAYARPVGRWDDIVADVYGGHSHSAELQAEMSKKCP